MDRQKIFWVVLSVSVFVVIVLVAGVMLLRQKPASLTQTPTVTPLSNSGTQVYEYQQSPGSSSTQSSNNPGGATQSTPFYVGENGGQSGTETTNGSPTSTDTTTTPAVQTPSVTPATTTPQPAAPTTTRPAPAKVTPTRQASTPVKPQRSLEYWIQTGAYKSPSKADELVSLLGKKGLTGRVFSTATDKSETFYRVRVGPYKNKGEAQKFLDIVKKVQGLEASYISQVNALTPVN